MTKELTEYFSHMRALQNEPVSRMDELTDLSAVNRLRSVATSGLCGIPTNLDYLIPVSNDPLAITLAQTYPDWTAERIVSKSYEVAKAGDDYSLVALAALSRDALILAALRESVVLYVRYVGAIPSREKSVYLWNVDSEIERRASKFVATFNELFDDELPEPCAHNAEKYFIFAENSKLSGRCVCLGLGGTTIPMRHYHWAIKAIQGGYEMDEFWNAETWTTQRYQESYDSSPR